jgi:YVTN family beta-propeller protein
MALWRLLLAPLRGCAIGCLFAMLAVGVHGQTIVSPSIAQVYHGGAIYAVAVQADGKVIIGGTFAFVNGTARNNIARINADGTLDATWNPNANATVWSLALDGSGNVYVGGQFSNIGGLARANIARIPTTGTGAADGTWNPNANGIVFAIAPSGSSVYVGGSFTTIGGQSRNRIAMLSSSGSGLADASWNPNAGSTVQVLMLDGGGNLYAGGGFTSIGGQTRNRIAKLSATGTGTADGTWDPNANSNVATLALDGSGNLYAGGNFSTIGGQSRAAIARLSTSGAGSADVTWNPGFAGIVNGLLLDGAGNLYVGGIFFSIGGQSRRHVARLSTSGAGAADSWDPSPEDYVNALALGPVGTVYVGGNFQSIGGLTKGSFAALSTSTAGANSAWPTILNPGSVRAIARDAGGGTFIGGRFIAMGDLTTQRLNLARFNSDGTLDASWNPGVSGFVNALVLDGSGSAYVGGYFFSVGGVSRSHLAKVSATGVGTVDATWTPNPTALVDALALDGSGNIYVAGQVGFIGGQTRSSLAKVSTSGAGTVDATWDPNADNEVFSIALDGSGNLFAGGAFTNVGGLSRPGLAKLSTSGTGAADPTWLPAPNGNVTGLVLDGGGNLYVGGFFSSIGGQTRSQIAKVSTSGTGTADATWNPGANNAVFALALDGSGHVFAGGDFTTIGGQSRTGLAKLSTSGTGAVDGWNAIAASVRALALDGSGNVYVGGNFSNAVGQSRAGYVAIGPSVPVAPTNVGALGGNAQVSVSFVASASDGGSPITNYSMICNPGGLFAFAASSPITLSGLANGTTYSCSVTAINAIGTSSASAAAKATPSASAFAGPFAYVPNTSDFSIAVIDTATNVVAATIAIGGQSFGVAANPAGTRAYVTNIGGSVHVIDTATNAVSATVTVGSAPTGIAVNPAGTRIYVVNQDSNNVSVIDASNNTVIGTISVGTFPRGIAVKPDGTRVYVSNQSSGTVSVIDASNNTVIATVTVGNGPYGVAVNPTSARVYVANSSSASVSVIDTTSNTVVDTVPVRSLPRGIAVNPAGTRVYVANTGSNNVSVIDAATNFGDATVTVGSAPRGVFVNPVNSQVYIVNTSSNSVSVMDRCTEAIVGTISIGTAPTAIGVSAGGTPSNLVPCPPDIGTAMPGNAQASVAFSHSGLDGGLPITSYTVTSSPGGLSGSGPASPIVVSGLTNGTAYTFTVTATNAVGVSAPSSASNSVTPNPATVPGAPTILSAIAGSGQVVVSFLPPASSGGSSITGYTVTCNPGGITATGSSSPITVTGLANGTTYTCTITATNGVGTSSASSSVTGRPSVIAAQWTYRYAPEPYVRSVASFPNTPTAGTTTLFAATLGAGMFKGVDNGTTWTWQAINTGLPTGRIWTESVVDVNTIYVGTDGGGIYKTTDGGTTWLPLNGDSGSLGCRVVRSITLLGSSNIYAGTWCRYDSGLWFSNDAGHSWERKATSVIPSDTQIHSVTRNSTGTFIILSTRNYGVFVTLDAGATWAQSNTGMPVANPSIFDIQCSTACSTLLAYVEGYGIYKSTDSGTTWAASSTGLPSNFAALGGITRDGTTAPPTFYLGSDKQGIYRSTDDGVTWSSWGNTGTDPKTAFPRGITAKDTTATGKYYMRALDGVYRTLDDGLTWTASTMGNGSVLVNHDVFDPSIAYITSTRPYKVSNIYAADWSSVRTQIDTGITGSTRNGAVYPDPVTAGVLYATTDNRGIFKSVNGGASWSAINSGLPSTIGQPGRLTIDSSNPQILYLGFTSGGGLYKSTNAGASWTLATTGFLNADASYVHRIEVDGANIFAATSDGLYKSTNSAGSWTRVYNALDSGGRSLAVVNVRLNPSNRQEVFIANSHTDADGTVLASSGILKSTNGGSSWTNVLPRRQAENVRVLSGGIVFAGLNDGPGQPPVLRSLDGGATWQSFSAGFTGSDIRTFGTTYNDSQMVSAVLETGLYTLADVPGVPTISAIVPGNAQATISFSAFNSGSTITSYTVTCNPGSIIATGSSSPITVTGLTNGTTYTCTVTATNSVGTSSASISSVPFMPGTSNPIAISTTESHALALDSQGRVFAWGNDSFGQLGQGRQIYRTSPTQVLGLPAMTHIALNSHALGVDAFKQVWSWGDNACGGQLGPREGAITSKPGRVIGAINMTKVAAGQCFSLSLATDGTVWGWGLVPGYGPTSGNTNTGMRQLSGLTGIVDISAGNTHALALRNDGTVWVFGENDQGQLGLGTTGAAQSAVQVPGLSNVTAIAAGNRASMTLHGTGVMNYWGRRENLAVVTTPTALPALGGTPTTISLGGNIVHATRADGRTLELKADASDWNLDPVGPALATRIWVSGFDFGFFVDAAGQLYAAGANESGQAGLGTTAGVASFTAVPSFSSVSMVAPSSASPTVVALKADGSVWFWGANTLGQSGDGAGIGSSVPLLVNIPATIRRIATGNRFSLALDTAGNVWGWGDNSGGPFGASLVNRATPAIIPGLSNVAEIAAGSAGLMLALHADGTVTRAGTLPLVTSSVDPAPVSGLTGIIGIAAGSAAYAIRNDGALLAWGGNPSGELGNGTTATSATPVQVSSITGSVSRVAAANGRAYAMTSDGRVWAWGSGVLGNNTSSGSTTPVLVTGITDAASVSAGASSVMVVRQSGGLLAWGDTGLADAIGQNALTPYAVAFHEPVRGISLGAGNNLGFLVGNTGLAWGYGFGVGSVIKAAIGDGAYVPRDRPVVLLASGGTGSVDGNNWYLDLDPATAETVPTGSTPKALGVSRLFGSDSGLSFDATVKYKSADYGKAVNNYVFALVPPAFFNYVKNAPGTPSVPDIKRIAKARPGAKDEVSVLAQLTPTGWSFVQSQLIAYSQSVAGATGTSTNILNSFDATKIPGGRFCIGYGQSSGSALTAESFREVLLIPGAATNLSGVPCILTGLYLGGDKSARAGSAATFTASVVGIGPTGSVQFNDGSQVLSTPIGISASSPAVSSASMSISSLSVGAHSIGASYLGDGSNAATSAEVPLPFTVEAVPPGESRTTITGQAGSDFASTATFTASVTGDSPTGTVQFKDGAANLGDAIPVVGGSATLRISTLGQGAHSITAAYSGDSKNAPSTSSAITHTVYDVLTTQVTLASSQNPATTSQSVTLTATVTGSSPTGSITFRDGGTALAQVALANGTASYTVAKFDAGTHQLTAEYSGDASNQSVTSAAVFQEVTLTETVITANPPRLSNISTRGRVETGEDVMIAGFVIEGATPKTVVINVAGPSLSNFGVASPLANPTLRLVRSADQAVLYDNDDWQNQGADAVTAIRNSGKQPNHALEPAIIATLGPGAYTAIVSGVNGGTGVSVVGVFEVDRPTIPLVNISTRGKVQSGENVMIAGITVDGENAQKLVINVAGPHLANFGVTNYLVNPTLELVRSSDNVVIATNDNWQTQTNPADVAAIQATGKQPNNSLEPALIATLPPGAYTAVVRGAGGGAGVAVVGVFKVP